MHMEGVLICMLNALHVTRYTLHVTRCALRSTLYTLHAALYALRSTRCYQHATICLAVRLVAGPWAMVQAAFAYPVTERPITEGTLRIYRTTGWSS